MNRKTLYRKIARKIERSLFYAEQIVDFPGIDNADQELLRWIEQGQDLFDKYRYLRDKEPR